MTEQKQTEEQAVQEETYTESPLLKEILESTTNLAPEQEAYDLTLRGLHRMISQLAGGENKGEKITRALVDKMVAELDRKVSAQMDEILHHEKFQAVESAWRSLSYLVDNTDFRENIRIGIVSVNKEELLEDFEDAPDITQSGLYKSLYTDEYGQFGGQPYAVVVGNYDFGPSGQDIQLLRFLGSVCAMSHAPFIGAAAPSMFGVSDYSDIPKLKEIEPIFESPVYNSWNSLRESEDARNIGLTLPRFLLRLPYGKDNRPIKSFDYEEGVGASHSHYLWGNAAFAFAGRLTDSFARFRWTANIIGPKGGGAVENLLVHNFEEMGEIQSKIPTEILLSERKEYELAEQGFIGLTMRKGSDNAVFFSANSIQKAKRFADNEEGREAETNYKLSTQLPYMFVINRLAHYLKVLQRENIGDWKNRGELEAELNRWLRQYVVDMENPTPLVRAERPLRNATVEVTEVPKEPGWYKVDIKVVPHFKYMGAYFTLSLVGKLDKK